MSQHDEFDHLWKDMSASTQDEMVKFYRSNGSCYRDIITKMATMFFQWLFLLNAGGLILTTTVIGNCITSHEFNGHNKCYLITLMVLYLLGIISISTACPLEQKRFEDRGNKLDQKFNEFNNNKTTGKELENWVNDYKSKYDWWVNGLQCMSTVFLLFGVLISIIALIAL